MIRILPVFLLIVAIASGARAESRAPNHLLGEDSPYLRQHLYNVVDWYPWGEEALSLAREQAKPIFLSIGYSSCHWCHVMEDESFEDDLIGAFLNDNFISIKIDRERRPDLDEQFMLVTEVLSGGGGWPNNVFLTSNGDPFFAGTYFPPDNFLRALNIINEAWREDRPEIIAGAQDLSIRLRAYFDATAAAAPSRSISG